MEARRQSFEGWITSSVSEKEIFHFPLPSLQYWSCCRSFSYLSLLSLQHKGNLPQEGNHSPVLVSAAAKRQKQLQLGSVLLLASMFKPSCSAGALLLPLARLVTYSQTPLGLYISTLHLPPAYDPVPVLDCPHESHFSYLPLPALPAEWQHGAKSRTHHYLAPTQRAPGSVREAVVQTKQLSLVISVWDLDVMRFRGKPVLPALRDSGRHGCSSLGVLL